MGSNPCLEYLSRIYYKSDHNSKLQVAYKGNNQSHSCNYLTLLINNFKDQQMGTKLIGVWLRSVPDQFNFCSSSEQTASVQFPRVLRIRPTRSTITFRASNAKPSCNQSESAQTSSSISRTIAWTPRELSVI